MNPILVKDVCNVINVPLPSSFWKEQILPFVPDISIDLSTVIEKENNHYSEVSEVLNFLLETFDISINYIHIIYSIYSSMCSIAYLLKDDNIIKIAANQFNFIHRYYEKSESLCVDVLHGLNFIQDGFSNEKFETVVTPPYMSKLFSKMLYVFMNIFFLVNYRHSQYDYYFLSNFRDSIKKLGNLSFDVLGKEIIESYKNADSLDETLSVVEEVKKIFNLLLNDNVTFLIKKKGGDSEVINNVVLKINPFVEIEKIKLFRNKLTKMRPLRDMCNHLVIYYLSCVNCLKKPQNVLKSVEELHNFVIQDMGKVVNEVRSLNSIFKSKLVDMLV